MRKVMLVAAMLAMVLAAAAPAFSQTATLQYSCDQIQAQIAAGAPVSQQQVLACFGTAAALQDSQVNVNVGGGGAGDTATAGGGGGTAAATAAGGALPPTGGASLIALGAGVLLVAGGLLARRIVR